MNDKAVYRTSPATPGLLIRGRMPCPKGRAEAVARSSPEAPGPVLDAEKKAQRAGAFKSKAIQGQETTVQAKQATPIQPESFKEDSKQIAQNQEQDGWDGEPGDVWVKKVMSGRNRHWPGLEGRKPLSPKD